MAARLKDAVRSRGAVKSIVSCSKKSDGRKVWQVTRDGHRETIITSSSSAEAMDDAMIIYKGALERLAKR